MVVKAKGKLAAPDGLTAQNLNEIIHRLVSVNKDQPFLQIDLAVVNKRRSNNNAQVSNGVNYFSALRDRSGSL